MTTAFVSRPVPALPPERHWKNLINQSEDEALATDPNVETFTVLSYNILCEKYATEQLCEHAPASVLSWEYRKELILAEVMNYNADFLCLQEVSIAKYEDYFTPCLARKDYEGVHWSTSQGETMNGADQRQVDGCATFYKASK